ncbi:hypothetical protein HMP06_2394 [Sphingomonas sp. HMP6]|nr:hypothetical protein HMP06_2394 [Sphingomonas sp. HMP6]
MESMTTPHHANSGLSDPAYAAFAWRRFRTIIGWMAVVAAVFIVAAIAVLQYVYGPMSWVAVLAVIGGAGGSIMLTALLMGLVFLSSGTGHDEAVKEIE